jgi:hypothetical protein
MRQPEALVIAGGDACQRHESVSVARERETGGVADFRRMDRSRSIGFSKRGIRDFRRVRLTANFSPLNPVSAVRIIA